jgi:eukaryotic-like serine/threonine-protein kinase
MIKFGRSLGEPSVTEQNFRLFVSSPGDVPDERRRIDLVVERINTEFEGGARIETVRWETTYYSAHDTFQKQIPAAADCELVIAIFKARLGTPLPDGFRHMPSGTPYPSGTAYEILSAIEARQSGKPLPDIYVFRYPHSPAVPLDAEDRADIEAQWFALKGFFDTWFRNQAGEFVAAFQTYDSTDDFARQVEACLRQWLAKRGHVQQGPRWDRGLRGSPFPGLSAFEVNRAEVFFGRSLATDQAINRLREAAAGEGRVPFLLILGASGAGKSSLVRAALLPRLTTPGTIPEIDLWRTAITTPSADPFGALAESLLGDAALGRELAHGTFRTKDLLAKQLAGDTEIAVAPLRDALALAAEQRRIAQSFAEPRPARLALAIDQVERLFIEANPTTATAFAELLAALIREHLVYLVLVLRSDAYAQLQTFGALLELRRLGATFDLVPPSSAELEEIVMRPVAACQPPLAFERKNERSLSAVLVADARGGDALPLLQMTLSRLYDAETSRGDGVLRFADYHGIDAAISEVADEALRGVGVDAQAELPSLVAGLVGDVTTDPLTGAPLPSVVALDRRRFEAGHQARSELIDAFIAKYLLTSEGDERSQRVRPVHEALLRIWPRAVAIVVEVGQLLRVRHTLEPIVREWQEASEALKPAHLELSPALLGGAQSLSAAFGTDLSRPMRDFIAAAVEFDKDRRNRERQEQERRLRDAQNLAAANRRTARRTFYGLAAALVLAIVAGWQWDIADAQRAAADTQRAAAQRSLDEALQSYMKSLDAFRKLAELDPSNLAWRLEVAASYEKIGHVQLERGDLTLALEFYRSNLTIREDVLVRDPGNNAWRQNVAVAYLELALALATTSDERKTLLKGRGLVASWSEHDPEETQWKQDIALFDARIAAIGN